MKEHQRLAEPDRLSRRTAMDALEVLRKEAGFRDEDRAEFHIGLMQLPSRDIVGLVDIRFESLARKTVCCVSLPTSSHFNAIPKDFPVARRYKIERLDGALIDGRGHVQLKDGPKVRAVEVEPAALPIELSDLDWRIVHLTLEFAGARHCYRSLREDFPPDQRDIVPDVYFLDVARVSDIDVVLKRRFSLYLRRPADRDLYLAILVLKAVEPNWRHGICFRGRKCTRAPSSREDK